MISRLICRLIGHRLSIKGVTGHYEWCGRCAARREVLAGYQPDPQPLGSAANPPPRKL